jgi:hypothetical protein
MPIIMPMGTWQNPSHSLSRKGEGSLWFSKTDIHQSKVPS